MNPGLSVIRNEYRRLRFFLIAAYMIIAGAAVAMSALYLWSEYRFMMQAAAAHTATLTRALEEHVLRTFTTIDTQLRNAGRRLIETRALEHPSTPRVVEVLREEAVGTGFLRSIYVYDAAGRGHTTSLGADIGRLRARDFEYLREVFDGPSDRLVIGRVISGAVTRRLNIPVARALLEKNGRLAGIIGTAIEPGYFEGFYRALNLEAGASLALLRDDGAVLVRFPEAPGRTSDVSGTQVFREHMAREAVGTADAVSPIDGIRRLLAFRHVPGWNLIVVNTLQHAAIVAPWWRVAQAVGLIVLASLGILLALLLLALRELKRRAEAEERYVLAVQGSNDGIWDWNILTHEDYLSPRWKEILGYRDEEIANLDSSFFDLVHPEDRASVSEAITRHLEKNEPYRVELRMRHKDGSYRWILARGEALRDAAGRAVRMAGSISDITDRKRAEAEILKLNTELEQRVQERTAKLESANKELETFTYSVAHDLKAPLRGIDGYSRLLLEGYADRLDDEGRLFLHNVRDATRQMDRLTNDLLAYSRLERQDVLLGQVDPRSLVEALLVERAAEIQARGVAVSVAVPCPSVSADRDGLTMALRNLLENALKFTRDTPNPAIEVGGRDSGDSCILWVRDNGVGFDMKYHERIFAIFQRLHHIEDYPGTGVGLAIVRKAMERMAGRAWAESEPGKGATFYLEIPK
jgi:PAS domain S-box-containing protein